MERRHDQIVGITVWLAGCVHSSEVKSAVVLLVVVLVLLTGIPLGMMHASGCPQCHISDGSMGLGACAAILAVFMLLIAILERRVASTGEAKRSALVLLALERPPQS